MTGSRSRAGAGLSPPTSSVRTITGSPPRVEDGTERRGLLLLRGQVGPVEVEELGAEQAHALRAVCDGRPRLRHAGGVGRHDGKRLLRSQRGQELVDSNELDATPPQELYDGCIV